MGDDVKKRIVEKVVNKTEKIFNDSPREWKKLVIIRPARILSRSEEKTKTILFAL